MYFFSRSPNPMGPRKRSINLYVLNKLERNGTEWSGAIDYQNQRNEMMDDI